MKKKDSAVRWGLALFLTVGAILLFYDTLFGRRVLPSFGGQLLKALQPVLIGAVLAYLLAPVIDFIENLFFPEQMKKAHAEGRMTSRSARAVSLVVTWAIIGLLCYLLGHVLSRSCIGAWCSWFPAWKATIIPSAAGWSICWRATPPWRFG